MIKYLLLISTLFFLFGNYGVCQQLDSTHIKQLKKDKKSNFYFFYQPTITKTNYDLKETISYSGYIQEWHENHAPTSPFYGHTFGGGYRFNLNKNSFWGVSFRHIEKGQQSPHFFNFPSNDTIAENYPPNYGGTSYSYKTISNEMAISFERQIYKYKKFSVFYRLAISLDIFYKFRFHDYIITKEDGIIGYGCCSSGTAITGDFFKRISYSFKEGFMSIGLSLSIPFQYDINNTFYLALTPELAYYTTILSNNKAILPKGDSFISGIQTGAGMKF